MSLAEQEELLLKIYSIDYLLKCNVEEATGKKLKLSPISGKVDMFQIYDPAVLLYYEERQLKILPAEVLAVDSSTAMVSLNYTEDDINEERRIFERYPVSLTVSARRKFSNKRLHFVVKNISMYGMGAISKADLDEEEFIDIDLITERNMFYFSGKVIWKKALGSGFEYGFQLTHMDVSTKQIFEGYLENQTNEYMKMISKAR